MDASQTRSRSFLRRTTVYAAMSLIILSMYCGPKNWAIEAAPIPLVSLTPSSSPSDMSISSPPLLKRSGTSPATDRMSPPNFCSPTTYSSRYCDQGYNPPRQSSSDYGNPPYSSPSGYSRQNAPSSSSGGNNGGYRPAQDNSGRD